MKTKKRVKKRAKRKGSRFLRDDGYRSGFEVDVARVLKEHEDKRGFHWGYETEVLEYTVPPKPARVAKYTPDFPITNKSGKVWYLEAKGRWTVADRKKHVMLKTQHPELDIKIFFQRDNKIRTGSKTKYTDFCRKHNIPCCVKELDMNWFTL